MDQIDIAAAIQQIVHLVGAWGLKVLGALVVLVIGRLIASRIRHFVRQAAGRANVDPTLIPFVAGLVYYTLLAVLGVAVLGMIGVQTASLLAVIGAAGLAIGLALQGTLSNFSAGTMLLFFRPFKVGDFVDIAGTSGTVRAVGLFMTELATPDNVQILVPNSAVWGETIKNYAGNDTRRIDLVIGISYDDDIAAAVDTIGQLLAAEERILADPAPVVAVSELADSSVNLVVRPWCQRQDYWSVRFDLTRNIKERLEAAGCSIPFPQRDVHLHEAARVAA